MKFFMLAQVDYTGSLEDKLEVGILYLLSRMGTGRNA
jgi:hypothetical protein